MHVLQREAKGTELREVDAPADATYDFAGGVWRGENGLISYDPDFVRVSKKADIETGEDQKGQ